MRTAPKTGTDGYACQNPRCAGRAQSPATCHGKPMVHYVRTADGAGEAPLDAMVAAAYASSKNGRVK